MPEEKKPEETIFYKIANDIVKSNKFYDDGHFVAFLDLHPIEVGHTLLIPKKPAKTLDDLDPEQQKHLGIAMYNVKQILAKKYGKDLSITNSNGKEASQEVPYFHIHFIPRTQGDRLKDQNDPTKSLIVYDTSSGFERLSPSEEELSDLCNELSGISGYKN